MENEVEFALRELASTIHHLIDVLERNRDEYNSLPDSMIEAFQNLMREFASHEWEVKA